PFSLAMQRALGSLVSLTDRSILRVAGTGSAKFLNGLCSQDIIGLAPGQSAAAVFLSPKGKVLCETLVVASATDELLLDCHKGVATSLLRLLIRHRLREPLAVEDVSAQHRAVAALPAAAASTARVASGQGELDGHDEGSSASLPSAFVPDPRFAAMGHRAILPLQDASALLESSLASSSLVLADYHRWRLCCAVPEGPGDMPVDQVLPLYANLDLLNFVSFSKGCYVGQELTTRTKHRGAVRRRIFSVVAVGDESEELSAMQKLLQGVEPDSPLPAACLQPAARGIALPAGAAAGEDDEARQVRSLQPGTEQAESKKVGVLHSSSGNIGLCLLRCDGAFNTAESFREAPLAADSQLSTGAGLRLALRAPPYAFLSPGEKQ
ncbi:unnamed protein product, partial [Polarella glacialis]